MFDICEEIRDLLETNCGASFNTYYVGRIDSPQKGQLPLLCVYGTETRLVEQARLTTCRDKYIQSLTVDVFVNVYDTAKRSGNTDVVIETQKKLYNLMEERDSNGIPKQSTVLGSLRQITNLSTTYSLFNSDIVIDYSQEHVDRSAYYMATMTFSVERKYNLRTP